MFCNFDSFPYSSKGDAWFAPPAGAHGWREASDQAHITAPYPGTHQTEGWMGHEAGPDNVERSLGLIRN